MAKRRSLIAAAFYFIPELSGGFAKIKSTDELVVDDKRQVLSFQQPKTVSFGKSGNLKVFVFPAVAVDFSAG